MTEIALETLAKSKTIGETFRGVKFRGTGLERSFWRTSVIKDCVFEKCRFPDGPFFCRVVFENCQFLSCTFTERGEEVKLSDVAFVGCVFDNCKIAFTNLGQKSPSRFVDTKIVGGRFITSHIHSSEFSNVEISCAMETVTFIRCFGTGLSLQGTDGVDVGVSYCDFDTLILPADTDECIWRSEWVRGSKEVYDKTHHLRRSPEHALEWTKIQHENNMKAFGTFEYTLLEISYKFETYADFECVMSAIRACPLDIENTGRVFLAEDP